MNELPPEYSPRASTFITTSTSNSPPLTPTSTVELPSYATTLSGRNEEPIFTTAAPYFELRPPPARQYDQLVSFRMTVGPDSHSFNVPFPQPEELWLERDVQLQDWMTFINFMVPPHDAALVSENKDSRNPGQSSIQSRSNAELSGGGNGKSASPSHNSGQGSLASELVQRMHNVRVDSVIREWNEDFFLPRGLQIIREVEFPQSEQDILREGLESLVVSNSDACGAQGLTSAEMGCPRAMKKAQLKQTHEILNSSIANNPSRGNPKLERKLSKVASKGLEKVIKWDQALLEKLMDRDAQFAPSTPDKDISFYQAVSRGDKSMTKRLLQDGVNLDIKDTNGVSALLRAVLRGDSSMVKLLLETSINPNACNTMGESPIYRAVLRGDSTIVKLLLALPIDTNAKTISGDTPIYRAASRGDSTIVKLLLKHSPGIDVNATAKDGKTALYRAVARGDSTIVKLLLENGADVSQTVKGELPISKATSRGNHTMAKMLSKKQEEQDSLQ